MKTENEVSLVFLKDSYKLNTLCRICLQEYTEGVVSLFGIHEAMSPSEKVTLCTKVKIEENDGFPNIICEECLAELNVANNFRMKCEQSDSMLRKVFQRNYNKVCEPNAVINRDKVFSSLLDCARFVKEGKGEDEENSVNHSNKVSTERERKHTSISNEGPWDDNLNVDIKFEDNGDEITENVPLKEDSLHSDCEKVDLKGEEKGYFCNFCNKCLKSRVSVQRHISSFHSGGGAGAQRAPKVTGYGAERRFHCTHCDYKTQHRKNLTCHIRIHTGERPYQCDVCPARFTQHATLSNHKKMHSDKTYYTCAECGKQFKHKKVFERHKRVHTNEKNYICTICNKALTTQSILKDHMKRHYNIKNYSCESCGAVFVSRSELSNHLRIHTTERKYQCSFCIYCTHTRKKLEIHIKRHTGEREIKCESCEYTCYTPGEIKSHMLTHSKERNYSCPVCEQKFKHSTTVNKHMRRVHRKEYKWSDAVDRRSVK